MEVEPSVDQHPFDLWRKFNSMFTFIMDEEADSSEDDSKMLRDILSKMGEQEGVFSPFLNTKSNIYTIEHYKGLFIIYFIYYCFVLISYTLSLLFQYSITMVTELK